MGKDKTILAVFAHPDDEAFGPGATLAKYALNGIRVILLTLTRGEAGSLGPGRFLTAQQLGALREEELRCAADKLHISHLEIHNLPDGKLNTLEAREGKSIIQSAARKYQPQVMITFHDGGISGHPDHIAVSRWCLETVSELQARIKLYYYGVSPSQARLVAFRKLIPIPENEITHRVNVGSYLKYKLAAIECHASQRALWEKLQKIAGGYQKYGRSDYFSQVWPKPDPGGIRYRLI